MAFGDVVQTTESAGSGTSPSDTFASATAGNLLVAMFVVDDGVDFSAEPSGWDKDAEGTDNGVVAIYVFSKVAAGGETSVSGTLASSQEWTVITGEFEKGSGDFESGRLDVTQTNYESSNQSTGSTGTTATTTQASAIAVACMGCQDGDAQNGTPGSAADSWTNSFLDVNSHRQGSAIGDAGAYMGRKVLTATGTVETTCAWNNTNSRDYNAVAVYKEGSGGGGGLAIPIAMHHYKQMMGAN